MTFQPQPYSYAKAQAVVDAFRAQHPHAKIGMTSGCYDLLHAGHREMLAECRKHCDFLVVSIAPDERIQQVKTDACLEMPIIPHHHRAGLVGDLKYVDHVVIDQLDDRHRMSLINDVIKPDIFFLGVDQPAHKYNGILPATCELSRVHFTSKPHSTTGIIEQIVKKHDQRRGELEKYQSGQNWAEQSTSWYL